MSSVLRPFFSVIVPACNVGPYVAQMTASLKAQTDGDFECIVVVEESSDNTADAVRRAVAGDQRFIIVESPCSGSASQPRNYGIAHAAGEYLVFLDGDDFLTPDALTELRRASADASVDLIVTEAKTWRENADGTPTLLPVNQRLAPPDKCFKNGADFLTFAVLKRTFRAAVWFYCVRTSMVRSAAIYQPFGRLHQDNVWSYRVCLAANRIAFTGKVTYNYRKRSHSVTWKIKTKSVYDMAANVVDVIGEYQKMCASGATPEELTAISYYFSFIFSVSFLHVGVFAAIPYAECRKALASAVSAQDSWRLIGGMLQRIRLSRRIEAYLLRCSLFPGCFVLFCLIARGWMFGRNLYSRLKKLNRLKGNSR